MKRKKKNRFVELMADVSDDDEQDDSEEDDEIGSLKDFIDDDDELVSSLA